MADRQIEHRLVTWLRERLPPPTDLAESAVVAPSAATASALRNALSLAGVPTIGVHFVTAPQLARLVCERRGSAPPTRRPDPLEERALLRQVLAASPGELSAYALRFPAARNQLARAVREWQQLAEPPAEPPAEPANDGEAINRAAQDFVTIAQALTRATAHFATRRSLFERAHATLSEDRPWAPHLDRILLVNPTPQADILALTKRLIQEHAVRADRYVLPDDAAELPPKAVHRVSSPTIEAELREAAAGCLAQRATGVPWREIVVTVPRLGAFAEHLARTFGAEGVPFRCDAERPLAFEPRAATAIHAARVLFGEPTRTNYLALLDAPHAAAPFAPDELRCFDALSRELHLRGRGEFVTEFAGHLRDGWPKLGNAPRVATALDDWSELAATTPTSTGRRIEVLREFLSDYLRSPDPDSRDEACARRLEESLAAIASADAIEPDLTTENGATFAAEFDRVLHERGMPIEESSHSYDSVQVLEYSDALARPATHLHLAGLSEEFWPSSNTVGESFLSEADRTALGLTSHEPQRAEQRAILDALCRHPTQSLAITRARRRARDHRPTGPSIWLDELRAPAGPEGEQATHPLTRAERRIRTGACPRDLALLRIALAGQDESALAEIAGPPARFLWHNARALERFEPTTLARDGDIGAEAMATAWREPTSATRLTALGYCPLRSLFSRELDLPVLPPEPDPCELPRDRIGNHIHDALEKVFQDFALGPNEPAQAQRDALVARACQLFETALRTDRSPLRRDFPTLHKLIVERWRLALIEAIERDLTAMDQDQSRPCGSEVALHGILEVEAPDGEALSVSVRGYADRLDRLADGRVRIIDFKTGKKPANDVNWDRVLNLKKPQLAIYAELLRVHQNEDLHAVAAATIRAVRPPELRATDEEAIEFEHPLDGFDAFPDGDRFRGFRESLAIATVLRRRGAFVPDSSGRNCSFCDFRRACRRLHPPSSDRVSNCSDAAVVDYMAMKGKRKRRPLLRSGPGGDSKCGDSKCGDSK